MSDNKDISKLNMLTVVKNIGLRKAKAAAAKDSLPKTYPVNELAKRLHPDKQYMRIKEVKDLGNGVKEYTLVPNKIKSTECAYFKAGSYLNVFLDINGMPVTRAYSISSSPKDSIDGFYKLTVKSVNEGLVSNYILDNWKEGDEVTVSGPSGNFNYNRLRDSQTVVGIAGGSGITPFLSFAEAIAEGTENFNLILLYGSRTEDQILFKDEFDKISEKTRKVKTVYILSDEEKEGFEHGFISADIIKKYAPTDSEYSIFLCGPQAMYNFADKEIAKLNIKQKFVRKELFGEVFNPSADKDYPGAKTKTVKITVTVRDETFVIDADPNDSIMRSLEKNSIAVPAHCRSGECGYCHSTLVSGDIYVPKKVDGRRLADYKYGGIHPCVTFPLSDIEIIVPPVK